MIVRGASEGDIELECTKNDRFIFYEPYITPDEKLIGAILIKFNFNVLRTHFKNPQT